METQHEKSLCCRGIIWRFGSRRRQCSVCRRTWSCWQKRRGPKRRRTDRRVLIRTLCDHRSLTEQARGSRVGAPAFRKRFRKLLARVAEQPPQRPLPPGALILIVDALWFRFKRTRWTLYCGLVRPVRFTEATILPPVLLPGPEAATRWRQVIATIPPSACRRIRALVSDGFRGAAEIAKEQGWVFQCCQAHLIRRLQLRRGRRKDLPSGALREAIYQGVRAALESKNARTLQRTLAWLRRLCRRRACPRALRMIVRQFLRDHAQYLAYQRYPQLHLPATTNTAESLGQLIRSVARPLRTPLALERWVRAFIRFHPTIVCNGKHIHQQK